MKIENSKLKIAVLMGGIGEERHISIQSGNCVAQALKQAGFNVVAADIGPDNMDILEDGGIDVFFIALHGKFGEDGQLQQILEDKELVYTGSGPQASRLAFDKLAGKERFAEAGVAVPKAVKFDAQKGAKELEKELLQLSERFVIKPLRQGSAIGVTIVDAPQSAVAVARQCSGKFGDCMIEEFVPGREVTVGILGNRALPIIEIKSKTGFYDYQAKYLDERTEFLFDTIDDPALTARIETAALDCFNALGCRHFARVDFILGDEQNAYALEVNTIPGFTSHSLLPMAAARAGLSMSRLCMRIIEAALADKNGPVPLVNPALKSRR
ncbi:MAG: D-alanine--D-alanine ligase family protein [Planctomycetota bacterium]